MFNAAYLKLIQPFLAKAFGSLLNKKALKIVDIKIIPYYWYFETGGWTLSTDGVEIIHSYKLLLTIQNPGKRSRAIRDVFLTWHLESNPFDGNLSPRYKVADVINVAPDQTVVQKFSMIQPSYYIKPDALNPFTLSYKTETGIQQNINPITTVPVRQQPEHIFHNPATSHDIWRHVTGEDDFEGF